MFVYLDDHSECDWDNVLKLNYPRSSVSVSKKYTIESLYLLKRKKSESEQLKEAKNQEGWSLLLSGRTAVFNFLTNRQNSSRWNFLYPYFQCFDQEQLPETMK